MRCPDCQKFVSLEFQDPEVDGLEIADSTVSCTVRLVRNCGECGQEMKEANLELSTEIEVPEGHSGKGHELEVEETSVDQIEEGGGRFKKSYFGATVSFAVKCSCQPASSKPLLSGEMSDKIQASGMDEMV
jgi:hypothetical protein